jgi:hypothetical protein
MKINCFRYFSLTLFVSLALTIAVSHPAKAGVIDSKTLGDVSVVVTGDQGAERCSDRNLQLSISRSQRKVLDYRFSDDVCELVGIEIKNLDDNPEPEIVVTVLKGRFPAPASCIYSSRPNGSYDLLTHDWGLYAPSLEDLDSNNQFLFISYDSRFIDFGGSTDIGFTAPPQIWRYRQGQMLNVTRQYPAKIREHANETWQAIQQYLQLPSESKSAQEQESLRGSLAAYLADKYLLGEGDEGWQQVRDAYQESDRQEYFGKLEDFLKSNGYIERTARASETTPLNFSQVQVGGVRLGDSEDEVIATLGAPQQRAQSRLNDGLGITLSLRYPGLQIGLTQTSDASAVSFLKATSSQYATVDGVRVGDNRQKILDTYGTPASEDPTQGLIRYRYESTSLFFILQGDRIVELGYSSEI